MITDKNFLGRNGFMWFTGVVEDRIDMIEIILLITAIGMIGLASLNWSLIQAIITENERQRQERTYLSEQRENKLNENR